MLDPKAELDMLRSYWIDKRVMVKGPGQVAIIVEVYQTTKFWADRGEPVWFHAVYEQHIDTYRDLKNCPSMRREENRNTSPGYYRFQVSCRDITELPDV